MRASHGAGGCTRATARVRLAAANPRSSVREIGSPRVQRQDALLEVEPDVAGDLVVARTAGVDPRAGAPVAPGEPVLDGGMSVLVLRPDDEPPGFRRRSAAEAAAACADARSRAVSIRFAAALRCGPGSRARPSAAGAHPTRDRPPRCTRAAHRLGAAPQSVPASAGLGRPHVSLSFEVLPRHLRVEAPAPPSPRPGPRIHQRCGTAGSCRDRA